MVGCDDRADEPFEGLDEAVEGVHALIDAEVARGVPRSRIVLGGFSMVLSRNPPPSQQLGSVRLGSSVRSLEPTLQLRLRLAEELPRLGAQDLLVLDLPAAGEHPSDVASLDLGLCACREAGATVVAADNHPDLCAAADAVVLFRDGGEPRTVRP